jgi:hypothetical protein
MFMPERCEARHDETSYFKKEQRSCLSFQVEDEVGSFVTSPHFYNAVPIRNIFEKNR